MLEIGTKAPEFTLPDQNGEMKFLAPSECGDKEDLQYGSPQLDPHAADRKHYFRNRKSRILM